MLRAAKAAGIASPRRYPHLLPTRQLASLPWWEPGHCSACRDPLYLRPDEAAGAFVFCDDCLQRTREVTEWDDLGCVD